MDIRKLQSPSPILKDTEKVLESGNRLSDERQRQVHGVAEGSQGSSLGHLDLGVKIAC